MRCDKWLWSVRLFKTRTQAADACSGGKVKLGGDNIKPAKELKIGDVVEMKRGPIHRSYKVIGFPKGRLGAKEVPLYCEDITPETEVLKLETLKWVMGQGKRERGTGRPTKKERREMDDFISPDSEVE
ncbi:MAG: RNA-binding S4 domain-containing protein [Flavobacteriales bacterium]|nr:RNA-binding S4 domain-containing protein [Flavobacteriales bacterium]